MELDDLTIGQAKQLTSLLGGQSASELRFNFIGKKWFIRTVTYHLVGECTEQIGKIIKLENASWVADSGRFMDCIKEGKISEVEPVGDAYINTESISDFFPWLHKLPKEQK